MELTGKIHEIFDAKQVTERFRKREFVLETNANPRALQYILMELTNDRCDAIDDFELSGTVVPQPRPTMYILGANRDDLPRHATKPAAQYRVRCPIR